MDEQIIKNLTEAMMEKDVSDALLDSLGQPFWDDFTWEKVCRQAQTHIEGLLQDNDTYLRFNPPSHSGEMKLWDTEN